MLTTVKDKIEEIDDLWRDIHFPPETASIALVYRLLAMKRLDPTVAQFLESKGEFYLQDQIHVSWCKISWKHVRIIAYYEYSKNSTNSEHSEILVLRSSAIYRDHVQVLWFGIIVPQNYFRSQKLDMIKTSCQVMLLKVEYFSFGKQADFD